MHTIIKRTTIEKVYYMTASKTNRGGFNIKYLKVSEEFITKVTDFLLDNGFTINRSIGSQWDDAIADGNAYEFLNTSDGYFLNDLL